MARLKLDNVFYETTNPSKIERLIALGAEEVKDEEMQDEDKSEDVEINGEETEAERLAKEMDSMSKNQIIAMLETAEFNFKKSDNKDQLIKSYIEQKLK